MTAYDEDKPAPAGSISGSLLVRARSQDAEAWRQIVNLYGPQIYAWCRHANVPAQDASDIVQDVFGAVTKGIASFRRDRPGDTFRGWVWTITRNKADDYWRNRASQPLAAGGTDAQQKLQELPEDEPVSVNSPEKEGTLFRRALDLIRTDFEERTWQAFWEHAVEERHAGEVAAQLQMSVGAVYMAKARVLRRLREEFAELIE